MEKLAYLFHISLWFSHLYTSTPNTLPSMKKIINDCWIEWVHMFYWFFDIVILFSGGVSNCHSSKVILLNMFALHKNLPSYSVAEYLWKTLFKTVFSTLTKKCSIFEHRLFPHLWEVGLESILSDFCTSASKFHPKCASPLRFKDFVTRFAWLEIHDVLNFYLRGANRYFDNALERMLST